MSKILYLPILEPGANHDTAVRCKRGLLDALRAAGHEMAQIDYLDMPRPELFALMNTLIRTQTPDIILTQLHGADIFTPEQIREWRALAPDMLWINWSGDSWAHSLTAQPILDMAREFDMQLVAAPAVLPIYAREGVAAGYWQIAYEPPVEPLPDMPHYDVVFLANVINEKRRVLMERLKAMPGVSVGVYGDWANADGRNTYDFPAGEALYKNAKIAIADNVYQDQTMYMSNRPIQALCAGGALLLQQYIPGMVELSGLIDGLHYVVWENWEDLEHKIRYWIDPIHETWYKEMVEAGQRHALTFHTYAVRVKQLFYEFIPQIYARRNVRA